MNKAAGLLPALMHQSDVAERKGVSQSVISRLWGCYHETGSPIDQHPGRGHATTVDKDRFLGLTTRRQPKITAP